MTESAATVALSFARPASRVADLVALTKPGILAMCVLMTIGGAALAADLPGYASRDFDGARLAFGLLGAALSVAGANALNMWLERDGDRLMRRTRARPLPAGRMRPAVALLFGLALAVASQAVMCVLVNPASAWLSGLAIASYVLVYTPMKRMSTQALAVGAVPGAVPPLLGWTIVTGHIHAAGLVLFAILFVWQLPHFMAIAIYRRRDYEDAGIHVVPNVRGLESAKVQALAYALLLVAVSLLLVPLHVAGFAYFSVVTLLGAWFFVLALMGFEPGADARWARRFFFASLVYLPVLCVALVVDRMLA